MAYNNTYGWNRPVFNNGTETRWFSILKLLNENGPMTKKEILSKIWNTNFVKCYYWSANKGCYSKIVPLYKAKHSEGPWRGYSSHLFACMHEDRLIVYNPNTYTWHIGWYGTELLERYS